MTARRQSATEIRRNGDRDACSCGVRRLRFGACFDFLFLRRRDFIEVPLGEVAVPDFLVLGAETRIAGRLSPCSEENHVFVAGVVELIKLSRGNRDEHAGSELARGAVGKVKRAFALYA